MLILVGRGGVVGHMLQTPGARLSCPAIDSSKGCRGWGCAPSCRYLSLGCHALGARARPACLAADLGERV